MSDEPQKQMLYLWIEEYQGSHYVRFELAQWSPIKHGYKHTKRRVYTECAIDIYDTSLLLREDNLKEELGFWLILGLFIIGTSPLHEKQEKWCQLVFPHHRGQQAVIKIESEVYKSMPSQKLCSRLLLPYMDVDKVAGDESFKRTLAEHVLKYLPISKEFCFYETSDIEDH